MFHLAGMQLGYAVRSCTLKYLWYFCTLGYLWCSSDSSAPPSQVSAKSSKNSVLVRRCKSTKSRLAESNRFCLNHNSVTSFLPFPVENEEYETTLIFLTPAQIFYFAVVVPSQNLLFVFCTNGKKRSQINNQSIYTGKRGIKCNKKEKRNGTKNENPEKSTGNTKKVF